MITRILTALIGLPVLIFIVWIGGWVMAVGVTLVTLVALYEYVNALNSSGNSRISYLYAAVQALLILFLMKFDYFSVPFGLVVVVFLSILYEVFSKKADFNRAVHTIFFMLYVPLMFGYIMLFENVLMGQYTIWLCFLAPFATDTFAYFGGRLIGGKKLTPVSPNKTVSGSVCGLVACTLFFVLYGIVMQRYFSISVPLSSYIILGVVASIAGQIGDICASLIKRTYGVKDYGNILPGHGGILDRFDSVIFTIPVIYFFTYYVLG